MSNKFREALLFFVVTLLFLNSYSPTYALTNYGFDSDNSNWNVEAIAPSGWVDVPGNSTYGTSNFLTMKYEAKIQGEADGNKAYNASYIAESRADGTPWVNMSPPNAVSECSALGASYHLLNNNEWMTVARNIEAQAANWTLGAVGQGYLFAGYNNDPTPAAGETIPASATDTGNYRCAYTDGSRAVENPASCPTNTANGTSATAGNQVRTHSLSNGYVIWDFAGNASEQLSDSINEPDQPVDGTAAFNWQEFTAIVSWGTLGRDAYAPANLTYDSTYGVGKIYSGTQQPWCGSTVCSMHRGGTFFDGINVGIFSDGLDWGPTGQSYGAGFRCASDATVTQTFSATEGRDGGGNEVAVSSIANAKLTQSNDTSASTNYDLSVYIKDKTAGNEGGTINSSVAQLYFDNSAVSTSYESAGDGWWKLSATLTGSGGSKDIGILIVSGRTVVVDQFNLAGPGAGSATSADLNFLSGWARRIDAGPHYIGDSGFIHGEGPAFPALAYISPTAHHDDVDVVIVEKTPAEMMNDKLVTPFPWMQGLNTAGNIYKFSAYSSFNGYPVTLFDNPVTIVVPYDPARLWNVRENQLRIAYYDFATNKWKLLNRNTVINTNQKHLANTTREFTYFTVVYPVSLLDRFRF